MVDNNISESFNSWILEARHKPIVTMLEEIRTKAMIRITENKKLSDKWFNNWPPKSMETLLDNKELVVGCRIVFSGDSGYEIGEGDTKHTVFLDKQQHTWICFCSFFPKKKSRHFFCTCKCCKYI
ncbi:unnamed protein product [Cuscuta europaea]|uniref:Uncharacterized protein n=1 Tax=Cuscuta europaea TaxID=41803 RepID=A0A9P1EBC9_CUSEU|nr:unnamed protein product [Cuscuta europaea]